MDIDTKKIIAEMDHLYQVAALDKVAFFGDSEAKIAETIRGLRVTYHPDKVPEMYRRALDTRLRQLILLADDLHKRAVTFEHKRVKYSICDRIGLGDTSDVYAGWRDNVPVILKISRFAEATPLLKHEAEVLKLLNAASKEYDIYKFQHPLLVDSFQLQDNFLKQVNVFEHRQGKCITLAALAKQFPVGLSPRHLAWIFKRMLNMIGFAHSQGIVHGGVLPYNILIYPETHTIGLLDWKQAGNGEPLKFMSKGFEHFYPREVKQKQNVSPATDIYMAAKCIGMLGHSANAMPSRMEAFFRFATFENSNMRPQDAWEFASEFSSMLLGVYGKPQFIPLEVK